MTEFTRRRFMTTAASAAAVVAVNIRTRPSDAAEFVFKFGNNVPETYPLNVRTRAAAERIRAATGGRFELQIFPSGQLGSDSDMLSQVRSGAIHFYTASGLVLSTLVPLTAINAVGFAFKDYGQVWPAMDGALGAYIRARIETAGLHPIDKIFDIGFREITAAPRPIANPADLKGFKIRIPSSQLGVSMFKAFGASPATLNFSEVYTALQTHVVDGQENPLSIIDTARFYEVQKYCSMTNHMWDGFWFLMNRRAWAALPDDIKAVVAKNVNAAAVKERVDTEKLNITVREELAGKGLVFNQPDVAPFREKLRSAGFYAEWKGKYGDKAWEILEKSVGKLS